MSRSSYTREELAPLVQTNVDSLKEYGIFTYAKVDGRKQPFFAPEKQNPIHLVEAPAACTMAIQLPNDGSAAAQKLGEASFLNGNNSSYGAMFANKVTVDCP